MYNCNENKNFPLSLNKDTKNLLSKEDMGYDYPFMRISGSVL